MEPLCICILPDKLINTMSIDGISKFNVIIFLYRELRRYFFLTIVNDSDFS